MKRKVIYLFIIISSLIYGKNSIKFPIEYEAPLKKEAQNIYNSGSEIRNYIEWEKDSYISMREKLETSNISNENKQLIIKRLFSMYRYNFSKQNSVVNDEIEKYMLLENKEKKDIKKEKENKVYIEKIIENSEENSKKELEFLKKKAEQKYPNDYEKQKIYIEAVLENLNIYKFK